MVPLLLRGSGWQMLLLLAERRKSARAPARTAAMPACRRH
jgi:hypothetical protein